MPLCHIRVAGSVELFFWWENTRRARVSPLLSILRLFLPTWFLLWITTKSQFMIYMFWLWKKVSAFCFLNYTRKGSVRKNEFNIESSAKRYEQRDVERLSLIFEMMCIYRIIKRQRAMYFIAAIEIQYVWHCAGRFHTILCSCSTDLLCSTGQSLNRTRYLAYFFCHPPNHIEIAKSFLKAHALKFRRTFNFRFGSSINRSIEILHTIWR